MQAGIVATRRGTQQSLQGNILEVAREKAASRKRNSGERIDKLGGCNVREVEARGATIFEERKEQDFLKSAKHVGS